MKHLVIALLIIGTNSAQASNDVFDIFKRKNRKQKIEMVIQTDTLTRTPIIVEEQVEQEEEFVNPYSSDLNYTRTTAEYDSLIAAWHNENIASDYDAYLNDFINIDSASNIISQVPDSILERRLRNIVSPIQLPFNDVVKRYIVSYTTTNKRTMEKVISLSRYYFPIFEEALDREQMPLELRMLPVVESALQPAARSRVGATGLWQFMFTTGRQFGLEVTSLTDHRQDPVLATNAACKYLKYLYGLYDDWTLALAAYNCGPGNVNKALSRAGKDAKTYWDIYYYLPRETRGYVPAFVGATYAYTYYREHGLDPDAAAIDLPIIATDTIMVNKAMHFNQVSSTIPISIEVLRSLNPMFTKDIIPAIEGKSYPLIMPASQITAYIDNQDTIMGKDSLYLGAYINPSNLKKAAAASSSARTHKVKSGDTLGAIARKYGVSTTRLAQFNGMKTTTTLSIGRVLQIPN